MKRFVLAALLALLTTPAFAQGATQTLAWDYPVALSEVQTYTQSVSVNGTFQPGTPACVATSATVTTCQLAVTGLSTTSSNTVAIAANKGGVSAVTTVTGININSAPKNAGNPRVIINVNITVAP